MRNLFYLEDTGISFLQLGSANLQTTQRNNPQYVALNLNSVETPNLTTLLYLHALTSSQLRRIFSPKAQALIQ